MNHTKIQWRRPTRLNAMVNHVFIHGRAGSGMSNLCEYTLRRYARKEITSTEAIQEIQDDSHKDSMAQTDKD